MLCHKGFNYLKNRCIKLGIESYSLRTCDLSDLMQSPITPALTVKHLSGNKLRANVSNLLRRKTRWK